MTESQPWRVLIPVRLMEGEPLARPLIALLEPVDTVVLGYFVTKDQVTPEHARNEFGRRANQVMDDLVAELASDGRTVETRLVFTPNYEQSIDRIAKVSNANVVLYPGDIEEANRILVATRGRVGTDRMASFVRALFSDTDCRITFLHVVPSQSRVEEGEEYLETVVNGIGKSIEGNEKVNRLVEVDRDPLSAILDEADNHDLLVIGESEESWRNVLFGNLSDKIRDSTQKPVFVVRQDES